jgi:hypothetical protein
VGDVDRVTGFHGTTQERAQTILAEGFQPSANDHDWIGHGVYFWERAPRRAWDWAAERYPGDDPCVVAAAIELRDCLDLVDTPAMKLLARFFDMYVERQGEEVVAGIRQTFGARRLDCEVLNFAAAELASLGHDVKLIRAPFEEGTPIFDRPGLPASQLRGLSHVQIVVRDVSVLGRPRVVERGETHVES